VLSKIRPRSYGRYVSLPLLGPVLNEFIDWSEQRGYAVGSIQRQLEGAAQIDRFLRHRGVRSLSNLNHEHFAEARRHYRLKTNMGSAIGRIEQFLAESVGLAPLPAPRPTPSGCELSRYERYLERVHGFAESTIRSHIRSLREFLDHIGYDSSSEALKTLTSKEIESFICACAKRFKRSALQNLAGCLRHFLRYQHDQGVVTRPLYAEIDGPRVFRLEQLPRSLSRQVVEDFLRSIDQSTRRGIRDYTIFYLMSTYGLRTCEVVALTLDDIDWRAGIIQVPPEKSASKLVLPLTDPVGEVLIKYLKTGRPTLPFRELFLRARAPHGPVTTYIVGAGFKDWVRRSGLDIPYRGPHCLRHSQATHLLRQGATLKEIGDLLGHRGAESTCVYLRLATDDLRTVALPVPQSPGAIPALDISLPKTQPESRKPRNATPAGSVEFLKSFLAQEIRDYVQLKRSLGRKFRSETVTLQSLDTFLAGKYHSSSELTPEIFNRWCRTLNHVSPTTRRCRMLHVRNFCLYHRRSQPNSFLPDMRTFPDRVPYGEPYIFSELDVGRLLIATQQLGTSSRCPLRPQTIRIAIALLYTCGLRHSELLGLQLGDYNLAERSLTIRDTKFHKSRIIPLSDSMATELGGFLNLRAEAHLPMDVASPIIWNGYGGPKGKGYTQRGLHITWGALCLALRILTPKGRPPRIHDLRHSMAVNALQRWYQAGENVQAKLPLLSTFMGHVSIDSTCYYLPFVEGIRSEASARFRQSFGSAVTVLGADA